MCTTALFADINPSSDFWKVKSTFSTDCHVYDKTVFEQVTIFLSDFHIDMCKIMPSLPSIKEYIYCVLGMGFFGDGGVVFMYVHSYAAWHIV